jgi:hypothetical protein
MRDGVDALGAMPLPLLVAAAGASGLTPSGNSQEGRSLCLRARGRMSIPWRRSSQASTCTKHKRV